VLNGIPLAASGRFDGESVARPSVTSRVGGVPKTYRIHFQQEAKDFSDAISGVVTDGTLSAAGEASGGTITSNFVAHRNVWVAGTRETGLMAGKYTLALPLRGEVSDAPLGISLLSVSPVGMVLGRFSLTDGLRTVLSGTMSKDGVWVPYGSLYARTGFLTGALDFKDKGQEGVLGGEMDWRRNASGLELLDGIGVKYVPVARSPLFPVKAGASNVEIDISGGGLESAINEQATLTVTNLLQVVGTNSRGLSFRFDRLSGGFTGKFTGPGDTVATAVTGVVLQSEKRAIGYFVRNGVRGFVSITAVP
jgi:hypothetical protein